MSTWWKGGGSTVGGIIEWSALRRDYIKVLALDEADKMPSNSYEKERVDDVVNFSHETVQVTILNA